TEPIVRAVLAAGERAGGCGSTTVRVTPRGEVLPCVYWPKRSLSLADLDTLGPSIVRSPVFTELDTLPDVCRACPLAAVCHGGRRTRRRLGGGPARPADFCPFVNGKSLPILTAHAGSRREFPKAGSACTTVFGTDVS